MTKYQPQRDILDLATTYNIVEKSGAWFATRPENRPGPEASKE